MRLRLARARSSIDAWRAIRCGRRWALYHNAKPVLVAQERERVSRGQLCRFFWNKIKNFTIALEARNIHPVLIVVAKSGGVITDNNKHKTALHT